MKAIFLNPRGLRSGWRLLIFVGIFVALGFAVDRTIHRLPFFARLIQLPDFHPVGLAYAEVEALVQVWTATWVMARIERRRFADYGIPARPFGGEFWEGTLWGIASTTLLIGLIAVSGGYRIVALNVHGSGLWYFTALWLVANLLIGFSEELQFRAYLLTTLADGIGFWAAAVLLSIGFGALHYFLKPHERWEDFASTGLLGLFMCATLRRTGSLAFAIGFHAAFDFANLFVWSGQNGGQWPVGRLFETRWPGPLWLTGGPLGPEASWMVFPVIALLFALLNRRYPQARFIALP
jgi:membrane protease YdiL (CAAX protease family)